MNFKDFSKKVSKPYVHFDFPLGKKEKRGFFKLVKKPSYVVKHRFFPFIKFEINFQKHPTKDKKVNKKVRPIAVVSHHDAGIYGYYATLLNEKYNAYTMERGIDQVAVAYRTGNGHRGVSNVTVAHEVFDFIDGIDSGWVMKGDFKGFFDNLDHQLIDKNLMSVLGELPGVQNLAWRKVVGHLKKFQAVKKETLKKRMKLANYPESTKKGESKALFDSIEELGRFLSNNKDIITHNLNGFGIPQGTGLSAVLANVYMIEFDEFVQKTIFDLGGLYRRYSDDFIVVLPQTLNKREFEELSDVIIGKSKELVRLEIEKHKTKQLQFTKGQFFNLKQSTKNKVGLDYLGFLFADNTVSVRGSSIYKYYYRGRKAFKAATTSKNIYQISVSSPEMDFADVYAEFISTPRPPQVVKVIERKIRRIKRQADKKRGLPEIHGSYRRYGIDPKLSRPKTSYIAYALIADKEFKKTNHSYKVVILHQMNKQRSKLTRYYLHR